LVLREKPRFLLGQGVVLGLQIGALLRVVGFRGGGDKSGEGYFIILLIF
jgi:hypothetical protein